MKRDLFVCKCGSPQHQLIVSYDLNLDDLIYVHVHLTPLPLWKRVIHGIMYIFGKESIYGEFEEIILNEEEIIRLKNRLDCVLIEMDSRRSKNRHITP